MTSRSALARIRRSRGHTQESLATRLGVDVSSVARWERGAAMPAPGTRRLLAGELALSLDELDGVLRTPAPKPGGAPGPGPGAAPALAPAAGPAPGRGSSAEEPPELIKDIWGAAERDECAAQLAAEPRRTVPGEHAVRAVHQWLITPPPPAVSAAGPRQPPDGRPHRVGRGTLEALHARIRYLREADDTVAGGDLHTAIRDELARTAQLLRTASYGETTGRALLRAVAELGRLAGWSTADAGHARAGDHYHLYGIKAAHAADDPVLAAHLVSSLGYHLAETGRARDAVLVTRSALTRLEAPGGAARSGEAAGVGAAHAGTSAAPAVAPAAATPAVRALLHARAAWAHAVAGAHAQADEAALRAQDAYARRTDGDPDPDWVYWLTADEMEIIVGRLDIALGRHARGRERLAGALRQCAPHRVRETALYTVWLAQGHLREREFDCAAALAGRARGLSRTIRSAYSDRAVRRLDQQLAARTRTGATAATAATAATGTAATARPGPGRDHRGR